ncbi:MAG: adenylate/guanylate cyclase domain-containing protein, partial [Proteobacteria bacterium]
MASTAIVFGVVEYNAREAAIEKLHRKVDEIVAIQSAVLSESMWNVADEQIELILASLMIDPDVLGAVVYDEEGNPVTSVGAVGKFEGALFRTSGDIMYAHRGGRETVGRLEVALTDSRIESELRSRLLISAALAALLLLSLIASALIGNRRTIGIPLERLLAAINNSRETGRRVPVDWSSRDEIGEVVTAFNQLQARQESYEKELRDARDQLERRVEERTRELADQTLAMERLSNQLAKFLPPQVYDKVFAGETGARVAAARKKLTVFFSDIAGFTETADRLESEALIELVNHYLTEMSRIALRYGATIDKYMGDGIMIFFGDPDTRGESSDALACVKMALEMRERMQTLGEQWRESGVERPLKVRMGIHTGYCTVGNFGSDDRMDYRTIAGAANNPPRPES